MCNMPTWPLRHLRASAAPVIALLIGLLLSACAADTIADRRFGQQVVCHNGSKTLTVSNADSFVHLDHGDSPGPCPDH
jgi:hypothetical protein